VDGVTVRLAGTFAVTGGGAPDHAAVGSRKARLLLALLAVSRGRVVPTDRIVDVLWTGQRPRRPEREVATLVSRLRAALGAEVVLGTPAGYRLGDAPAVRVDLDEAAMLLGECRSRLARGEAAVAAAAGQRACGLLGGGPALADVPDADWVVDLRAEHTAQLRAARHATAEALLRAGDVAGAVETAQAAVRVDRLDEPAHRLLMAAHQAGGELARALAVFERLRTALVEELGVDPAPETRAVHRALLTETSLTGTARAATFPAATFPAAPAPASTGPALAGRTTEMRRLTAVWATATTGRPALLLVAGEGGIGKTRLAAELALTVEATGGRVLTARCYTGERSLFLQPLVDALDSALAALPTARLRTLVGTRAAALTGLWPDLADELGTPVEHGTPELQVRRSFEAVTTVLRGLATDRPTLLLLDDLHQAGLATVELLHYLARHAAPARLLVLATLRTGEGADALDVLADVAHRLDVGPLPDQAVTRMAEEAGQGELAATILRRTRGHPLFVVETLRGLAAGETGPPETLQAAVLARLRRVGRDAEDVLRAGAVLGASVDPAVVAGMLDLPEHAVARCCAEATGAGLLAVAERDYEFTNDLVQEILYATTPAPVRRAHHRRAADLSTAQPEVVGRHAAAAGDGVRAARAFLLAGEQALARFATADAEELLSRALDAAERARAAELLCRALLARGRARHFRGADRAAVGDFRAGLATAREAGDRRYEVRALRELGGHGPTAIGAPVRELSGHLEQGLRIALSLGDREAEADLLARLAILQGSRLRFTEAVGLGRRAVAAGRAARSDRALALGLDGLKTAHAYLGEVAPLTTVIDELEPLLRRLGDLERLQWTVFESAVPAFAAARWDEAERRMTQAVEVSRRGGFGGHEPWFVAHLGWLARLRGRFDLALAHGRAASAQARRFSLAWFGPTADALLAGTMLDCGDARGAAAVLRAALDAAGPDGSEAYRLRCLAPLAEATGDPAVLAEAERLLGGIETPPGSAFLLGADAYLCVARARLRSGDPGRARAVLAPLLAAARRLEWIPVLVTAGHVDARAAAARGDADAAAVAAQARALAERHGMATALQTHCNTPATPRPTVAPAPPTG
jgi:DNA-binding SARP family transcriptional activator